ncbi:DNA integration/recombination/inversion protein [Thermus sp. CCB_US3_UF1]|uniref:tyrosine-type recombinase/integrase n=1 Tax=Thermus sp. CCB_US3_UF1 TaxID=1111069 RepID=UPI000238A2B3|nr:site-specific integrase [Thermus sp. CCB_US3_UF1]AEV15110.1 DNA integration/recombination/inversion protein [Thermus sp. CCB_US3_UF1]
MARGKGGGTTYYHKAAQKWVAELRWVDEATGKLKKLCRYARTRREAEELLAKMVAERAQGLLPEPSQVTVVQFAQRYLQGLEGEGLRPNSLRLARQELVYALPSLKDPSAHDPLGRMRLQEVRPLHVQRVVDQLRQGYAPRTVRKVLNRLRALFQRACELELLPRNPAGAIRLRLPQGERAARALEPQEVLRLLEVADGARSREMALLLRLLLETGLRRGEALALQWRDVDLERGELRVWRSWTKVNGKGDFTQPKTRTARRVVPLPQSLLLRLRAWKEELAQRLPQEVLEEAFLFGGNKPFDPDAFNHYLRRLAQRAGLGKVRVHDLRHTWASLALSRGIPLEVVSERLGHASPHVTLGIYRHLLEEERRGYVVDLETLLGLPAVRPQA